MIRLKQPKGKSLSQGMPLQALSTNTRAYISAI